MENRSRAYIAVLAVIAGSILMVGSLMKPDKRRDHQEQAVLPTQAETARLQRMSQRRSIESMGQYFAETANEAAVHLVYLEGVGQTAIVWGAAGTVITSNTKAHLPARLEVLGARGETHRLRTTAAPPESPAASLQAEGALDMAEASHAPTSSLDYGEWLVFTWLNGPVETAFAPGLYLGHRPTTCGGLPVQEVSLSVPPSREMAGAGLFDLDGRLIGIVTLCDGRYVTLLNESIAQVIEWNQSFMGRLLGHYGLHISGLADEEKQYFDREEGVIVREVWRGLPAADAGFRPGDLILSFDGLPVTRPEDLQPLVLPATRHLLEIAVRRGSRNATIVLPAQIDLSTPPSKPQQSGLIVAEEATGFPVETVLEGSPAAQLGIQPGDRLLRVDGSPVSNIAQAQRALSAENDKGRFIVVERGRKQWGALLN